MFQRKYGTALSGATKIRIPMLKAGSSDQATGSDWTPASGDVKISIDGGTAANIATLPAYSQGAWEFTLSGTELTGKNITAAIIDQGTKVVSDNFFIVETFGNASAMYPDDISTASATAPTNWSLLVIDGSGRIDVSKIAGTSQTARDIGASVLLSSGTGTGQVTLSSGILTANANGDFTATQKTSLNAATPIATVSDKTGFSLTSAYDAAKTAAQAGDAMDLVADAVDAAALATDARAALADAYLDRDMSLGTDSGTEAVRTPRQALRVLRNKVDIPNGKVKKEDDSTDSWTFSVTTAAGNPVTVVDPSDA